MNFDLRLITLDLSTQKLLFTDVLSPQYSIVIKILMFYMNIGNVPLFILSLMHYLIYEGILRKSSRFTLNSKKNRSFHFEFLENVFVPLRVMSLCMYMNNSNK